MSAAEAVGQRSIASDQDQDAEGEVDAEGELGVSADVDFEG